MVNPNKRNSPPERDSLGHRKPDQERTHEPGTARNRDAIQVLEARSRLFQRPLEDRKNMTHVLARGQLWHHATERPMDFVLR